MIFTSQAHKTRINKYRIWLDKLKKELIRKNDLRISPFLLDMGCQNSQLKRALIDLAIISEKGIKHTWDHKGELSDYLIDQVIKRSTAIASGNYSADIIKKVTYTQTAEEKKKNKIEETMIHNHGVNLTIISQFINKPGFTFYELIKKHKMNVRYSGVLLDLGYIKKEKYGHHKYKYTVLKSFTTPNAIIEISKTLTDKIRLCNQKYNKKKTTLFSPACVQHQSQPLVQQPILKSILAEVKEEKVKEKELKIEFAKNLFKLGKIADANDILKTLTA